MDERQLRAIIQERIRGGLLPGGPDRKTYGGKGTNSTCACCSNRIGCREVEYEIYFDGYPSGFRAHLACYRIWWEERECNSRDRPVGLGRPLANQGCQYNSF